MAVKAGSDEKNPTYAADIQPIIKQRCLSCHGSSSPGVEEFKKENERFTKERKGPRMDTYENLITFVKGKDAGALMRRLDDGKNTKDGKPGNMYRYLGTADAERAARLDLLKKWVGKWTLKRRAEMTEDELKGIKAAE